MSEWIAIAQWDECTKSLSRNIRPRCRRRRVDCKSRTRRIYAARVLKSALAGNNAPHSLIITTNKRNRGIHEILV